MRAVFGVARTEATPCGSEVPSEAYSLRLRPFDGLTAGIHRRQNAPCPSPDPSVSGFDLSPAACGRREIPSARSQCVPTHTANMCARNAATGRLPTACVPTPQIYACFLTDMGLL